MRLDKFLKVTRIIKRRTIAQELCDAKNVKVNGDAKKPSYEVKKGDNLEIKYYSCLLYTSPSPRDVEESRMPSSA